MQRRDEKGFTLIEILFALAIGLVTLGAIYVAVDSGQRSSFSIERKVVAQQDSRAALQIMSLEIGMASFNPNFVPSIWRNPGDCVSAAASQAYRGIPLAAPDSITIEMDIDESGTVANGANEVIRYAYDTTNQRISRETNCGGGQPFLGDLASSGRPKTVRIINNTLGINNGMGVPAIFRYYNGQNPPTELYPGVTPADIPDIRRIDIILAVETDEIDSVTGQRRRMIFSSSVIPRNHAIGQ